MKRVNLIVALFVCLGFCGAASATLFDRGRGLIYDDILDVTWLQNANLAGSLMTWENANSWATSLSYSEFDSGWRLPSALDQDGSWPCSLHDCTGSEMGHMFYNNLGGIALVDFTGNQGLLSNIQPAYWSGTESSFTGLETASDVDHAWTFRYDTGWQFHFDKNFGRAAWAVRDGDVPTVPEPTTLALITLGLAGLRFRRKLA